MQGTKDLGTPADPGTDLHVASPEQGAAKLRQGSFQSHESSNEKESTPRAKHMGQRQDQCKAAAPPQASPNKQNQVV